MAPRARFSVRWFGPVLVVTLCAAPARPAPLAAPLVRQEAAIPLPGVEGRLDHMALDDAGRRLFVVALAHNTVEVIDLDAGRRVRSLAGFHEPQGVAYLAASRRLVVTNGGDGTVALLDGPSLRMRGSAALGDDADNVRVDPAGRSVAVGHGEGALATLDPETGKVLARWSLPAHPEAFEFEPGGSRIFVNVPGAGEVAVLDRSRPIAVAHWKLAGAHANFPMALDVAGGRLFVGCRQPATLLVLRVATGESIAAIPIDGDVDDLFYDPAGRRLLASCGAGFLDVVSVPAGEPPRIEARIPTAPGARTSLYDPPQRRLFLAVPHRGAQPAEIRIYRIARRNAGKEP